MQEPLSPNELADLYDALFAVLDNLPKETHPAWKMAVESVVFGGEGNAPGATNYGEQQAERNEFKITEYRDQYGDGERVTRFPTLEMEPPRDVDQQYVEDEVRLPVAPNSEEVLPLFVGDDDLADAISLLDEFPPEPSADAPGDDVSTLLEESKFPGVTITAQETSTGSQGDGAAKPTEGVTPNELADLYDGLRVVLNHLPADVHPVWADAIETMVFGGEALADGARPYGEQQAERNTFGMPDYRSEYGNGSCVTEFPTLSTAVPQNQEVLASSDVRVPLTPESETPLPLNPPDEHLVDALSLLSEFPAEPSADDQREDTTPLIDTDQLIRHGNTELTQHSGSPSDHDSNSSSTEGSDQSASTSTSKSDSTSSGTGGEATADTSKTPSHVESTSDLSSATSGSDSTILRQEGPGEGSVSQGVGESVSEKEERKYEDPRAERAHRRAQ